MNARIPVTFRHLLYSSTTSEQNCDYYGQVGEDMITECTESPDEGVVDTSLKDYDVPEGFRRPDHVNDDEEEEDEENKEGVSSGINCLSINDFTVS